MNEETKHIEQLPAEEPIAQAFADATSEDLLTESLQPLFEEAQEGYTPVAVQPYTSPVAELPAAVKTLIRTVVRRPLAMLADRGTSRRTSLLDALLNTWNALRARLAGDAEWSIPDRRNEMTGLSLSSAFGLLKDRDMSSGIMLTTAADGHSAPVGDDTDITRPLPDGLSLAQLLCSDTPANLVTEIVDSNTGWTMTKALSSFGNIKNIILGCGEIANNVYVVQDKADVTSISLPHLTLLRGGISKNCANVASISVPNLEEITTQYMTAKAIANSPALTHIEFPKLRKITQQTGLDQSYQTNTMFYGCSNLVDADFPVLVELAVYSDYNPRIFAGCGVQIINMPKLTRISNSGSYGNAYMWFSNLPRLWKIVFGTLETCAVGMFDSCPCLIHLEIGDGTDISMNFSAWNPTTALNAELSDLVEDPEAHPDWNNLAQFLSNFRDYIADRLTANGSGLTLTLSQEVRDAIHAAETTYHIEDIIVNQKHWTLSPAPSAEQ